VKNRKPTKTRQASDPFVLLKRAAIAILILVAMAIALNLLQQALFPDDAPPASQPTPAAGIFPQDLILNGTVNLVQLPAAVFTGIGREDRTGMVSCSTGQDYA